MGPISPEQRSALLAELAEQKDAIAKNASDTAKLDAFSKEAAAFAGTPLPTGDAVATGATSAGETGLVPVPSALELAKTAAQKAEEERKGEIAALKTRIKEIGDQITEHYKKGSAILLFIEEKGVPLGKELEAAARAISNADVHREDYAKDALAENDTTKLQGIADSLAGYAAASKEALAKFQAKKEEVEKAAGEEKKKTPAEIDKEVKDGIQKVLDKIASLIPQTQEILLRAEGIKKTDKLNELIAEAVKGNDYFKRLDIDLKKSLTRGALFDEEWLSSPAAFEADVSRAWGEIIKLDTYVTLNEAPEKKDKDEAPADTPEKTKDAENLQKLKVAYQKAKKDYYGLLGIKGVLKNIFKKGGEAKNTLDNAEKAYNDALVKYTEKYIEKTLQDRITEVNGGAEALEDERKKNTYLQMVGHYKKTGLQRLALSAGLFGLSAFLGVDTGASQHITDWVRRPLSGVAAGFGVYSLFTGGIRLAREQFGLLRDLKQEKIATMPAEKLIQFLAAREFDAHERNIDIKTDGIYIAMLERLQTLQAENLERGLEKELEKVDEKLKVMKRFAVGEKALLLITSAVVTAVTGTGLIFQAGNEIRKAAEAIAEHSERVGAAKGKIQYARELIAEAHKAAEESARSAAQAAHFTADQTTDLIKKATEVADAKAKALWHAAYDHGDPIQDSKTDTIPGEAKDAAQKAIDETIKALQQAGGTPKVPETPAQIAAGMSKLVEQLANTPDANTNPALQKALAEIIEERVKHGEGAQSILKIAEEYTRIWTAHHEFITNLASDIVTNDGKLPADAAFSLERFDALRKVASWHGTPLGDAAAKALHLIDKDTLATWKIDQIDITAGTATGEPHTLYEAFKEAAQTHPDILHGNKLDAAYLDFIHQHGLPKIDLEHAKNIVHAGKPGFPEHLWVSGDDVIMSQEHEMLDDDVVTGDTGSKPEAPVAKPAAEAPVADAEKPKTPEGKAPPAKPEAAKPGPVNAKVDVRVASTSVPTDATKSFDSKLAPNISDLPKEFEWLTDIQNGTALTDANIANIRDHGREFAKLMTDQLKGWYTIPPNSLDRFVATITDPRYGKENIRALFDAWNFHQDNFELVEKDGRAWTIEKK